MSLSKPKDDNVVERAVKAYARLLHKRPVLTKAVTSACTSGLGNLLSQLIAQRGKTVQWRTVAAFAATGLIFVGPAIHYFLVWMDKVVPRSQKYSTFRRIILDRFIFAPPFLLIYFYLVAIFEGQSSKDALNKIRQFFWPMLVMNWKIWTPLQYININYVPREYRVLFANFVSLGWTIYAAKTRK